MVSGYRGKRTLPDKIRRILGCGGVGDWSGDRLDIKATIYSKTNTSSISAIPLVIQISSIFRTDSTPPLFARGQKV